MRKPASSLLLLALLAPAAGADVSTKTVVSTQDRPMIAEMRQRHILGKDTDVWTPEEYTSLFRVREAEALGAFDLLRAKLGGLAGYVAEDRDAQGFKSLRLTAEGYHEFIFLKSQDARAHFEEKGVQARYVFLLTNLRGRLLFDPQGILTQEGDEVYNRVLRKIPVYWRFPDGHIAGNARLPKDLSSAYEAPSAPAPPPGSVEEAQARAKIASLLSSGYVEVTQEEVEYLLKLNRAGMAQLQRESSLQAVSTKGKITYLISPSDPLMGALARRRAGK